MYETKYTTGDPVVFTCQRCQNPTEYTYLGGPPRLFCPECLKRNGAEQASAHKRKHKRKPGELKGYDPAGLASIALCSQSEAAQMLALWEALDRAAAGDAETFVHLASGDIETVLKPITFQAVQQLERRALLKVRKAMEPYWKDYKDSMASKSDSTGVTRNNGSSMASQLGGSP